MIRVITTLTPLGVAAVLLGCATGPDEVSVPVADAVVTAPVATVVLPQVDESIEPTRTASEQTVSVATEPAAPTSTADAASTAAPVATERPATSTATTVASPPATDSAPANTETTTATTLPTAASEAQADDGYLRRGDEGPEVGLMQFKLSVLGYLETGSDSGIFDQATENGLRRFQADYGLGVDGVFGPLTGRALNAAMQSITLTT